MMPATAESDHRQFDTEIEFDTHAQQNVVVLHAEVYPGDAEKLVEMFRTADDFDDVFLIWRLSPTKAREIARKLLEVADVCDQIGDVPVARKPECVS